jgi:hypothetical protein
MRVKVESPTQENTCPSIPYFYYEIANIFRLLHNKLIRRIKDMGVNMRRIASNITMGLCIIVFLSLTGCGDGGGGGTIVYFVNSTPSISNLHYSPTSATLNQGGGSIAINGTYDFIDYGADLAGGSVTVKAFNLNNIQTINTTTPITGNIAGLTSGTLTGPATADTTVAGTFNFVLYITDSKGNKSNELTGTFTVQ